MLLLLIRGKKMVFEAVIREGRGAVMMLLMLITGMKVDFGKGGRGNDDVASVNNRYESGF